MAPARPVGQESKKTVVESESVSNPHPSDTVRGGNEQRPSSGVYVPATSRDTTGATEQRTAMDTGAMQSECETPLTPKSYLFLAGVHGVRNKLQHAKDVVLRPLRTVISRLKGRNSKIQEPIQTAGATQLPIRSSTGDEPLHSNTMQDEEKNLAATTPHTGDQQISMNSMNVDEEINKNPQYASDLSDRQLRKHYRARSRDSKGSSSFINPADKSSVLDIIQAVQRLNAELEQNAPYIVDSLEEDLEFGNVATRLTEEGLSAVQKASEHVGKALMDLLGTKTSDEHRMLLQIAIQAYLASVLCGLASPWVSEPGDNSLDDGIYDSFSAVDAPSHSRAHVHITHDRTASLGSLVEGTIAGLSDILIAAGCTITQSDVISKVMSKFEERLTLLVELAVHLNMMLHEVLLSDVFVVRPGDVFDRQKMESAEEDQAGIQEGPVLCTVELGLVRWVPGETSVFELELEKQKMIVLKAKVLLVSFLDVGG